MTNEVQLDGIGLTQMIRPVPPFDTSTPPSDGQALVWDSVTGKYRPGNGGSLPIFDLRDFAAGVGVGNSTADTAALEAAWAYMTAAATSGVVASSPSDQYDISRSTLVLPSGSIIYDGTGLTDTGITGFAGRFAIRGAHNGTSEIRLSNSNGRLIDIASAALTRFELADFQVRGGKGLFRHQRTADNVFGDMTFRRLVLRSYTGAAIEYNSQNMPYVKIQDCVFRGADTLTTMGIALSGIANGSVITNNHFMLNRVHVKLRRAGNDVYFDGNDFLRFSTDRTNGPCTDLWLVPSTDFGGLGAGAGTHLTRSNKFGNENFLSGDFKILLADEGSGSTNGAQFPATGADSTGYIEGLTVHAAMYGAASAVRSPIYSTTPNVFGCDIDILHRGGDSLPAQIVELRTPATASTSRYLRNTNRIAITGTGVGSDKLVKPSNARSSGGVGNVLDPSGQFAGAYEATLVPSGGMWGDYRNILGGTTGVVGWANGNGLTKTGVTGAFGTSAESVEATFDADAILQGALSSGAMIPGRRAWVEGLVRQGSTDPMPQIGIRVNDLSSNLLVQRVIEVPIESGFLRHTPFRFSFIPDTAGGAITFFVVDSATDLPGSGPSGKVRFERIRCYQSREPVQLQPRMEPLDLTQGVRVLEGAADSRQGVATLASGTVTVSTTAVTANSRIMLTPQTGISGAIGFLGVTARTAGTSFTITARDAAGSTVTNDTRQVAWVIFEPMP
jgi:hypothetical protein